MSAKITFKYVHSDDIERYSFYRIPKQLFTLEPFKGLSSDAKILYALMLDRVSLSLKNGWIDDDKRVYIYFSVEDVMEQLGCGKNKAIKMSEGTGCENRNRIDPEASAGTGQDQYHLCEDILC